MAPYRSLLSLYSLFCVLLWSPIRSQAINLNVIADNLLPLSPRQAAPATTPLQYGLIYSGTIPSTGRYTIGIDAYMQPISPVVPGNCSLAVCGTTFPCAAPRPLTSAWLSVRMTAYFYASTTAPDFVFNITCYKPVYISYRNVVIPGQAVAGAASTLFRTVVNTATLTVSLSRATTTRELPAVTQSISLARETETETLTTLSVLEQVSTFDRISTLDRVSTFDRFSTLNRISTFERVTTVELDRATTTISLPGQTIVTTLQATSTLSLPRETDTLTLSAIILTTSLPRETETLSPITFTASLDCETETLSLFSTVELPQVTTTQSPPLDTLYTTVELPQATDTLTLFNTIETTVETTVSLPGETCTTSIELPQVTSTISLPHETNTVSLTNTIETTVSLPRENIVTTVSLPAETLVNTVELPQITSTLSFPPGTDTVTLITTVVPTQATTTLSLPRATQTIIVGVEPVCPGADGQTYALSDGSKFNIVCRHDRIGYDRYLIIGIPEVTGVQSFLACLYLCMNQGTACMGVNYDKLNGVCALKYGTAPYGGAYDYMAMRISGQTNGPSTRQIIDNGDFSNGLASWNARPNSLSLQNGAGMIPMNPDSSGFSQEQVTQSLSGAAAGDSFYLSMRLDMPPGNTHCSFNIYNGDYGYYGNWDFGGSGVPYSGLVNASGIFQEMPTELRLQFTCFGSPQLSIAIDDVSMLVFAQSIGANPIPLSPVEAIPNNDFSSGLYPWFDMNFFSSEIQVVNGRAVVTPTYNLNRDTTLVQYFMSTFGQNVHLQADVEFQIASGDTCTASLSSGYNGQVFWAKQVSASEMNRVDQPFTLGAQARRLDLTVNCGGSGVSSVAFDNVYFTLNAF